jgi:S1-C subfamily serine protease
MESGRLRFFLAGCGCAAIVAVLAVAAILFWTPLSGRWSFEFPGNQATPDPFGSFGDATPAATPTLIQSEVSPAPVGTPIFNNGGAFENQEIVSSDFLSQLYQTVSPGVVSINVLVSNAGQSGQGAGSGFIIDEEGHIVTNNHVVENANLVVVIFHDGSESRAEIVGTDPYSDLAVVKVEQLPESARALPLGDSNTIVTGDWVVAIGNPFGLNSSMSLGIVSAVGRTIPAGNSFSIPEAIQTDAAINPGNSGGPLLNLQGQVIGVNAQIASGGTMANAGVGFSIPSNIVRRVVPALIDQGVFQWPWLGIEGTSVNIFIAQANNIEAKQGAYIVNVIQGGPADLAGLQGGANLVSVDGVDVPTGGDVIIAADGETINDYSELLTIIASHNPGTTLNLTVLRNGEQLEIPVTLGPRPGN